MRKTVLLLLVLGMALLPLMPSVAEMYFDREAPEEWAGREDVMRLTSFATVSNDCTLVEVGGKSMLIDGGQYKWMAKVRKALADMGYDGFVNVLFNTHPHKDHLEAMAYMVKEGFRADEFWSRYPADFNDEDGNNKKAAKFMAAAGIPYRLLEQGETVDFGGAKMTFFWNDDGDLNATSAMTHITFGSCTVLMTADVTGKSQRQLLDQTAPELLKADILKFPHHGITPCVTEFLDAVDPSFIFVTNRLNNTPQATEQMQNRKIRFCNSSRGRVVMVTDGTDWYICQYMDQF